MDDLVIPPPQGLYCPAGDFYIDPWRPVHRTVITHHAQADHTRAGHGPVPGSAQARHQPQQQRRQPPLPGALQRVTFAKACSGLTDAEFKAVDQVIRATALEKFGPVRSLRPTRVFELGFDGFDGIARSPRHKSGIALRFPRLIRMRGDTSLRAADALKTLKTLLR